MPAKKIQPISYAVNYRKKSKARFSTVSPVIWLGSIVLAMLITIGASPILFAN